MTNVEYDRMMKSLEIMEEAPNSAFTQGNIRTMEIMDKNRFVYSSVSSGKDSVFMTNMAILELERRRMIARADKETQKKFLERYDKIRKMGNASQNDEDIELCTKWCYPEDPKVVEARKAKFINTEIPEVDEETFEIDEIMGTDATLARKAKIRFLEALNTPAELYNNMRIGVLTMEYELCYDQTRQIMLRFAKEYATDIRKIEPEGTIDLEKSVEENGYDLRWVSTNPKENPHQKTKEEIFKMRPYELAEIYGKAEIWLYDMYQSIAWEANGGTDSSRYISYEPDKRDIWVTYPPCEGDENCENHDPHHEWCITNENLYDCWFGLSPMFEIHPAMTDQELRVVFSKYITRSVGEAMDAGWPVKKYNPVTGKYE